MPFVLSNFLPKKQEQFDLCLSVTHCDVVFFWIHLSKSNECFWKLNHNSCHPSHVPVSVPLWTLSQQFMETDESVEKQNRARSTIVSGWHSNLNPPACLNSVCLSLATWDGGEGFALRPHLLSTEPWRRRRRPPGSKPQLQVPSPGLYQSRLELVSPHS